MSFPLESSVYEMAKLYILKNTRDKFSSISRQALFLNSLSRELAPFGYVV